MPRRNNRLIFLAVALISLTLYWSCSQPGDVLLQKSTTVVSLTSERLPDPPAGMIYELWVAKTDNVNISMAASDVVSLGRFTFDNELKKYFDETGQEIANRFILNDDIYKYSKMFVSVELLSNPAPLVPGPIMLIDDVTNPEDNPIYLAFPDSDTLHDATVTFNKETVSDRNRYNDGRGIWFCNYEARRDSNVDTLSLSFSFSTESASANDLMIECDLEEITGETLSCDTWVPLAAWDTISTRVDTVPIEYDPNTITYQSNPQHIRVDVVYDSIIDSIAPYQKRKITVQEVAVSNIIELEVFTQFDFNLPDYSSYGWKYKGWVVSKAVPTSAIGELTPPAWPYHTLNNNYIPGYTGGLITTGTFTWIDSVDDGNPYTLTGQKVPPYPGEDFLNLTALFDSLGLSSPPNLHSDSGTCFITLEPDNSITDTTNFPLFVMIKPMDAAETNQSMFNRTGTIRGDLFWFPEITVNIIERY